MSSGSYLQIVRSVMKVDSFSEQNPVWDAEWSDINGGTLINKKSLMTYERLLEYSFCSDFSVLREEFGLTPYCHSDCAPVVVMDVSRAMANDMSSAIAYVLSGRKRDDALERLMPNRSFIRMFRDYRDESLDDDEFLDTYAILARFKAGLDAFLLADDDEHNREIKLLYIVW